MIACEVIAIKAVKKVGTGCGALEALKAKDRPTVVRKRSHCLTPDAAGRAREEPPW